MKILVDAKDIYYRLECCKSSYSNDKSDYAHGYLMGIAMAQNMVALEGLSHRAIQVNKVDVLVQLLHKEDDNEEVDGNFDDD